MLKTNRSALIAAAVAVAMLVAAGAGYRVLAGYLARPSQVTPLPPGTLNRMPLDLGGWTGKDVPLDPSIVRETDTNAIINRTYTRCDGLETIGFYVAYGVQARDLMPHRPEVCYPGNGWTLESNKDIQLDTGAGFKLPCCIYVFSKGGLAAQTIVVLNYYLIDGRYCPDVSLLRSKAWRGSGGIRYMAEVQVTCSSDSAMSLQAARDSVREFAAQSAGPLRSLLPTVNGTKKAKSASAKAPAAKAAARP